MVANKKISNIFSKVEDNLQKISDPPQQQTVKYPPLYLIKCVQILQHLFPKYRQISYKMMMGSVLQVFRTSSTCPLQVQKLFSLKSLSHHQGCRLYNLQGWTRKGQVPNWDQEARKIPLHTLYWQKNYRKFVEPMQLRFKYLEFPRNKDIWSKAQTGNFWKDTFQMNWES